jgi:ribosome maturation factor RimP
MEVVMTSPAQSIGELVEPLVVAAGLELWDVEVSPRAVRVLVDRAGGVDLDSLAGLARVVSATMDAHEELSPGANYQLEVSSPGVERVLRTSSHFERYIGTEVTVKTAAPVDASGTRRVQGALLAVDGAGITIGQADGARTLSYDMIQKAHTVLIWGPQPKSGSKPKKAERMKDAAR